MPGQSPNKGTASSLHVTTRTTCRVCEQAALLPVLSLGEHGISDFLDEPRSAPTAPLELVLCNPVQGGCGLLQLKHTADQNVLYRNYWYRSGVNKTMRFALAQVVKAAQRLVPLHDGDIVLDTGSNDNTLLNSYRTRNLKTIGFEPAVNLMPYAQHAGIIVINDYFSAAPLLALTRGKRAKVITSIAMFYDLEDPNVFTADIAKSLHPDGLWIIQMMYLPTMLELNVFDNICHEHLEYYSLASLEALLERHRLKVVDVELNDVNGGSYRAYVTHEANTTFDNFPAAVQRLRHLRARERKLKLHTLKPYRAFARRVEAVKQRLVHFITAEVKKGKTVYAYGASTKGNTLLQYFGLSARLITAAAERNPDKWGKVTVATHIPIISEAEARRGRPDYFLVLPWHFLPEFVVREQEFLSRGGIFIVPLPSFHLIDQKTFARGLVSATADAPIQKSV